jgi:hypothetical protein
MLACDFFHVDYVGHPAAPGPVLRDRMSTRRVHVLEVTAHPDEGVDHSAGIETVKIPLRSRYRNWVSTVRDEVTDRMLIADPGTCVRSWMSTSRTTTGIGRTGQGTCGHRTAAQRHSPVTDLVMVRMALA